MFDGLENECALDEVCDVVSGQTPKKLAQAEPGDVPFVKVGDMNNTADGLVRTPRQQISRSSADELRLHIRPAGTVIFPKRGGAIATNKKRTLAVDACFDLNTMGVIPGPDVLSSFLRHWFETVDLGSLSDGSNVPQINHGDIKPLRIPVPPIADQARLVAEIDEALEFVAAGERGAAAAARRVAPARSAILAAAFSGQLVPQDPSDEPASMLLERIAAERAASKPSRKKKGGIVTDSKALVDKLWNYCNVLRDDGLSYGDYVEQLTYLLFLKMSEEQRQLGLPNIVPEGLDWPSLLKLSGEALEAHYILILNELGTTDDMLGVIFRKAQNRIQDPAKLQRLIHDLINGETWMGLDVDIKGDAYEGLLERNAADTKSGAGQYFTPRALISAMVDVMQPTPDMRICDPACGTGGFFLAAYDYIIKHNPHLDRAQKQHLRSGAFTGWEIVENTARLCAMNMLLHGIETPESDSPIRLDDALRDDPGERFDLVLANPPFGKKSSVTIVNAEGKADKQNMTVVRDDFWASTSNKQLNFVQHMRTLLKIGGQCAVVVPDNVLFEGGAGETIRRKLLHECNVHTLLRLPTGIFYAQGVKANVLFFERKPGSETPWTKDLWIYDLRTNQHFTLKQNPLTRADLDDFVACYRPGAIGQREETERFKRFSYDELIARDKASLDIFWLHDESLEDTDNLPAPGVIAAEIVEDLRSALEEFEALAESLAAVGVDIEEGET